MMFYVVYTDLDGTLIDEKYSFKAASQALETLKIHGFPLVFCSSKTRGEILFYREKMSISDPFIAENGAAAYIPKDYFDFPIPEAKEFEEFNVLEFGLEYDNLWEKVEKILIDLGIEYKTFKGMSVSELSIDSGLSLKEAALAKDREYSVIFKAECEDSILMEAFRGEGLSYTRGARYHHVMGAHDKGVSVRALTSLFRKVNEEVLTVGLGDSLNDLEMLASVDLPISVRRPDGSIEDFGINGILETECVGPIGWNESILGILSEKTDLI
ncbi:MAG: HAD-IIB family hydrolase [Methanobacteriota archaeon]